MFTQVFSALVKQTCDEGRARFIRVHEGCGAHSGRFLEDFVDLIENNVFGSVERGGGG